MKPNMNTLDKVVRILVALIIIGLYLAHQVTGIAAIILLIFAGVFIVTSFLSFCPLYFTFGISNRKKDK